MAIKPMTINVRKLAEKNYQRALTAESLAENLKKELTSARVEKLQAVTRAYEAEARNSRMLFEILRWHISPGTAEDPYNSLANAKFRANMREKGQWDGEVLQYT